METINTLDDTFVKVKAGCKDLTNKQFNKWLVLGYKGNQRWLCECQCEKHTRKLLRAYDLEVGVSKSCGCSRHQDLKGKYFGKWKVLEYVGDQRWLCECQCENHTRKEVRSAYLKSGASTSCGCNMRARAAEHMRSVAHSKLTDITNKEVGYWKAVEYVGEAKWKWVCQICGHAIYVRDREVTEKRKCRRHEHSPSFLDLTGKKINSWTAIKYMGNKTWLCECDCENKIQKIIKTQRLITGDSKSCGCKRDYYFMKSYGYSDYQINIMHNRDNFIEFIQTNFNKKPTFYDIANSLGVEYGIIVRIINNLELNDYINYNYNNSHLEVELYTWLNDELSNVEVIHSDRSLLSNQELDIYIPDKKLAVEFNGDYWHSDIKKDIKYHQNKTIRCAKRRVHLIHVFEHEWVDNRKQNIIKNIIRKRVGIINDSISINDTRITEITKDESDEFMNKYSLNKHEESEVNLGCIYNDEIVGVMTFKRYETGSDYEYELTRTCWKDIIVINNGNDALFNYFRTKYNPNSVVAYVNITKFTGDSYTKIGFKPVKVNAITDPNYIWVKSDLSVSEEYTSKSHIDDLYNTEMYNNDFLKIYDSGNIKLEWHKGV